MTAREPVDLTNCDREPIHIPGSIQRHGAMLVCEPVSLRLLFASRNAAEVTGFTGNLIPGIELQDVLGRKAAHDLRNAVAKARAPGVSGIVLGMRFPGTHGAFDAAIHEHEGRCFIEIEPCADAGRSARESLDLTRSIIQRIGLEGTVQRISEVGARLMRAMLGYDRVMVYRFLHNGAGRVIAEAKSSMLGSFMGQHFPASDIPAQARRLYLTNSIRMISDAGYEPIPLEPPLGEGENAVDMSFAQLRSVSPIHCEYLRNMGVAASLSISIVVDGKLWGLISCHHDTPKVTPLPYRVGAELFGQYFSLQIAVAERRAAMLATAEARARLDGMVADLTASGDDVREGLETRLGEFASLVGSNGAALWMNGAMTRVGDAPDAHICQRLLEIADREAPRAIWSTQELRARVPEAATSVAGALTIPLSMTLGDYLLLFRNEEAHEVEWAGEPVKRVVDTPQGERLTPRGSFETWRQDVKGMSVPWSDADIAVAEAIGTYLRDVILRQQEMTAEERARTEQRRRILNDELNHRVKNIISLVKSIALQTGAGASSVQEYSCTLEGRLQALAFAHDQSIGGTGGGNLETLVETEAGLHRDLASPRRVNVSGPNVKLDDRAFGVMALVIHEMMTNAVKYGALSVPDGRLDIAWQLLDDGKCELGWAESGGPHVTRPSSMGFGTKLIRSAIEYDLRGRAELDYAASGFRARLVIPAEHVAITEGAAHEHKKPESSSASLEGLSVLIVEDQGLIAMDAEETLRRLGAQDIRLSATVEEAVSELETFRPDAAVLDFNLGPKTSESVAELLLTRGVPFVFTTGYSDRVMIPDRFRQVPVVRKPISDLSIATQIDIAVRASKEKAHGGAVEGEA